MNTPTNTSPAERAAFEAAMRVQGFSDANLKWFEGDFGACFDKGAMHRCYVDSDMQARFEGWQAALAAASPASAQGAPVASEVPAGSWAHLALMMEHSAWDGRLELSDALANIRDFQKLQSGPPGVQANASVAGEGWKLVPLEPTVEMKVAGDNAGWWCADKYRAMLAAAPAPQPATDSDIIAACKAAGMTWAEPHEESGFPGAFDMPDLPAMRRLFAQFAAPVPQPGAQASRPVAQKADEICRNVARQLQLDGKATEAAGAWACYDAIGWNAMTGAAPVAATQPPEGSSAEGAEPVAPTDDEQLVATLVHCSREVAPNSLYGYDLSAVLTQAADRIRSLAAPVPQSGAQASEPVAWPNLEAAMADMRFRQCRGIMGTSTEFQDRALLSTLNHFAALQATKGGSHASQ